MIKSILKSALRNLIRHRIFSLINISGLVIGMSLCLLIILIVSEQTTFDNFHVDADRIYRINTEAIRKNNSIERYASSPFPLGKAIMEDYVLAEELVTINRNFSGEIKSKAGLVQISGLMTEPSFFRIFNFSLKQGDQVTALENPFSIILNPEAALKLFGTENVVSKELHVEGYGTFTVTGILAPPPGNTHLNFESLISISSLPVLENSNTVSNSRNNWKNYYSNYNYLKLVPGKTVNQVETALAKISNKYFGEKNAAGAGWASV